MKDSNLREVLNIIDKVRTVLRYRMIDDGRASFSAKTLGDMIDSLGDGLRTIRNHLDKKKASNERYKSKKDKSGQGSIQHNKKASNPKGQQPTDI